MSDHQQPEDQSELDLLRHHVAELQQRLNTSEEYGHMLRQVLNNLPAAIYITRADGHIAFTNTSFAANWGKVPSDFEGCALSDLFPAEIAAMWQQNVHDTIQGGVLVANQEILGEGDAARHYDNMRFPLYDITGTPIALGGVATDITDRVQAEASYAETRRILEGIVNNSPTVIYVKDPNNRLILVNTTYAAVMGRTVEDLIGRTEDELFPADLVASWRESDRQLFASGQPMHFPNTFSINGEAREFISVQFPLYDGDHQPYAICGLSTDVTDLKRAERDRENLQQEIIAAQQAALRELNTPLIPLDDDIVIMPLIGSIDSARATQVMETLLDGVSRHQAQLAILDITGLPVVDSQVANALLQAAQAVKLLGAEVLLTGIGPEVAQTLIGIGADLSGLRTPGTLQAGIMYALRHKRR
ncbi:PAS domain-containing protein [Candidatus Oscillochloris fontis]|uniref:PAS domain-containing protein n=1 Tax=Candidatus Oscillochloris fontis TaxID=2496868 RepID=UPI00101D2979|nr:PAS domain-containing protein [Candidatus Oscillochloris fontis]